VQDFDPAVQAAINRPQSFEDTRSVVEQLRATGIHSLNIDALYGLPLQTRETIARTIAEVISLEPDRVALFGYAHVPWMKKHQQLIREADLPDTMERFHQAQIAEDALLEAGYRKIGFDHFAKPGDSMAIADMKGDLHRNFQGYTTDDCQTMLGLGASSIGRYRGGYIQNIVATGQYKAAVERGELPAAKGFRLNRDDEIRGYMIERLMCDFRIDGKDLQARFGDEAEGYVDELTYLANSETDGLCEMRDGVFTIPVDARNFVRIVASRLDAYLPGSQFRYSKAV
jgi:oxygen-independent coproporphyrinogen-3 oxidase